jgi:hypothetical protein
MLNIRNVLIYVLITLGGAVQAHQFTPTYPQFEPSFIEGVMQTKLELFNKRQEVEYYELGVFDKDWAAITFAASDNKIIKISYLETKSIDVYVKNQDIKRVVYICTESRLVRGNTTNTLISSKICSKVK